tara:strand:+ start:7477 stop:8193 length:717 start_codon:yes stop_codon:yes gene_type:complete
MDQINEFVDDRQKSWCIYCGQFIEYLQSGRDHVPSKSQLLKPFPDNLPVVLACTDCNRDFSTDEQYFSVFLDCVLAGSTDAGHAGNAKVGGAFKRSPALRSRIDSARTTYKTRGGKTSVIWKPEIERVNRIVVKNARGHAFFEFGEPLLSEPEHVWAMPLQSLTSEQRAEFEGSGDQVQGWPEVGSRMLTRVVSGQDLTNGWVVVQDGVYRYRVSQQGLMSVRSVLRDYLATEVFWAD